MVKTKEESKEKESKTSKQAKGPAPLTLAIDVGGSGVKVMLFDRDSKPLSERYRVPTPDPATPEALLAAIEDLVKNTPDFDRVSIGFPGVIKKGKTMTAHNLHQDWVNFPLEDHLAKKWGKPVKLSNDADIQGLAAIKGSGVELVITLGTGLGAALFTGGRLVPNLELGHHPWRKGKTYEEYLGKEGLKEHGTQRWNRLLEKAIRQIEYLFNYDHLYIGGGNSKKIEFKLPDNVSIVSNEDGLLGGVALWNQP